MWGETKKSLPTCLRTDMLFHELVNHVKAKACGEKDKRICPGQSMCTQDFDRLSRYKLHVTNGCGSFKSTDFFLNHNDNNL